jgi:hypothetical protein
MADTTRTTTVTCDGDAGYLEPRKNKSAVCPCQVGSPRPLNRIAASDFGVELGGRPSYNDLPEFLVPSVQTLPRTLHASNVPLEESDDCE